jgi:hypothetical protein
MSDAVQRAPYAVSPPRYSVSHQMVTTAFGLPNYRIVQNLGVVRGIVVRSRNVFATLGATLQVIVGGNITVWTKLCEQTREDAFDIMIQPQRNSARMPSSARVTTQRSSRKA